MQEKWRKEKDKTTFARHVLQWKRHGDFLKNEKQNKDWQATSFKKHYKRRRFDFWASPHCVP